MEKMSKRWRWYVYIALCKDGTYYTGMTWNIAKREEQHHSGKGSKYTAKHGFIKIVYIEEFENIEQARRREKQIQGWTRIKKEKLIKGEWGKDW
jgi:putative endonuclease